MEGGGGSGVLPLRSMVGGYAVMVEECRYWMKGSKGVLEGRSSFVEWCCDPVNSPCSSSVLPLSSKCLAALLQEERSPSPAGEGGGGILPGVTGESFLPPFFLNLLFPSSTTFRKREREFFFPLD
jgi:hypothetical protein